MKKASLLAMAGAAIVLASCGGSNSTKTAEAQEVSEKQGDLFQVNVDSSEVSWKAFHKGGFAPRWGTIDLKSGEIALQDGEITGGDFVLDMTTVYVDPASVTEDGKNALDLQNHLKSGDFFSTDSIPTAEFKITKIEALSTPVEGAVEGANKTVSGNLTLVGNTVNVTFPAKIEATDSTVAVAAHFTVNRADWGIKFGTSEADPAEWGISKDIEIGIKLQATK